MSLRTLRIESACSILCTTACDAATAALDFTRLLCCGPQRHALQCQREVLCFRSKCHSFPGCVHDSDSRASASSTGSNVERGSHFRGLSSYASLWPGGFKKIQARIDDITALKPATGAATLQNEREMRAKGQAASASSGNGFEGESVYSAAGLGSALPRLDDIHAVA